MSSRENKFSSRIDILARYLGRQFGTQFQYKRVLVIVVESGAIYSSALIIEITLYFLNTNAFYIVYDPIAQLTVSYAFPTHLIELTI